MGTGQMATALGRIPIPNGGTKPELADHTISMEQGNT